MQRNQLFLILAFCFHVLLNMSTVYASGLFLRTDSIPENKSDKIKYFRDRVTVLINNDSILPLKRLDTLKIASLAIGKRYNSPFQKMLGNYMPIDHFTLSNDADSITIRKTLSELNTYNLIIVALFDNGNEKPFFTEQQFYAIDQLDCKKTVLCHFGNTMAIGTVPVLNKAKALLVAFAKDRIAQKQTAQIVFGAIDAKGKLPFMISEGFNESEGIELKNIRRLSYGVPEMVGIQSELLKQKMDSIIGIGLQEKAYPGCQVLIAKDGQIIFHKSYGFYTYDSICPVRKNNIYDWASVTKITGPLPALMKLHGEGKIDLDQPFSNYWMDFKGTDKEEMTFREVLAHQSGLKPWLPYWHETIRKSGKYRSSVFKSRPTRKFSLRVSSNLYENRKFIDEIYDAIKKSELLPEKEYVYSGLSHYLYPQMIENLTGIDYEAYLKDNFYRLLGAGTITYNAYKHFPLKDIIPTEEDYFFRKEQIHGFVHDEGAAMMGGVSGNAGLFGTANDLAKLMQMYMQYGYYGGQQLIDSLTVKEFIRRQYPENENRRGLGFDKPYIDNYENEIMEAYPAIDASENSFGHSGFTGTFTWADPDNQLLFIFFSNRVYPTRENQKLYELNLRPIMHQAIYDCLKTGLKED